MPPSDSASLSKNDANSLLETRIYPAPRSSTLSVPNILILTWDVINKFSPSNDRDREEFKKRVLGAAHRAMSSQTGVSSDLETKLAGLLALHKAYTELGAPIPTYSIVDDVIDKWLHSQNPAIVTATVSQPTGAPPKYDMSEGAHPQLNRRVDATQSPKFVAVDESKIVEERIHKGAQDYYSLGYSFGDPALIPPHLPPNLSGANFEVINKQEIQDRQVEGRSERQIGVELFSTRNQR